MKSTCAFMFWLALVCVSLFALANRQGTQSATRKPIELKHLRGVVADPMWAVIPKARVTLQIQRGEGFRDIESVETDETGRFDFGKRKVGNYRIFVIAPRGFCQLAISVRLSEKGWPGLKLAVPVAVTDTYPGYCDERLKIEQVEK